MEYDRFLSAEAKRFTNASLAGLVHRFSGVEGVISLAAGLPPVEAFPLSQLVATTTDGQKIVLGPEGRQAYLAQQYNFNSQGYDPLLTWLRDLMASLHGVRLASTPHQQQQLHQQREQTAATKAPEPPAASAEHSADGADPPAAAISPSAAAAAAAAAPSWPEDLAPTPGEVVASAASVAPAAPQPASSAPGGVTPLPFRPPAVVHDLVLTSGAIHAIFAAISCLTDPGDTLVVDEYTYTHALECVFLPRGLRLLPVRGDEQGMDPEDLDRQLRALQESGRFEGAGCRRPRLLYTIPTGHNPTGAVMSEGRKRRLLQVIEAHDLLILEDDAYWWLHYPAGPLPPHQQPGLRGLPTSLLALDAESPSGGGRVLRVDTFSKMLGPGYRLGWITAPMPLVGRLANWVQASTVGPCSVTQVLVARLLQQWGAEGFRSHVQGLQALYASLAAAAHEAAATHLRGLAKWEAPRAGMFMWVRLAGGLDAASLLDELVAARVVVVPGSMFAARGLTATLDLCNDATYAEGSRRAAGAVQEEEPGGGTAPAGPGPSPSPSPYLRLSFAGCAPEMFAEGVARLAAVIRAALLRRPEER